MEKFDQNKYMNDWKKTHMARVNASYNTEFVTEFKEACTVLGISQSQVFREAMEATIEKAKKLNCSQNVATDK